MPQNNEWISGKFSVDASGGACYSIPLEIPPGTGGMQPNLSLELNSARGLDVLGVGWILKGLSTIERVAWAGGDKYVLDSQQLVRLPADKWVAGKFQDPTDDQGRSMRVYRLEVDSGQIAYQHYDAVTGEVALWTVVNQNGDRMEFGATADSRPTDAQGNKVSRWGLNRVVDLCGNEYNVIYAQSDEGELRVDQILYTANKNGNLPARRAILFSYDYAVPAPERHFNLGEAKAFHRLLTRIEAVVDRQSAGTWRFDYESSPATGRPRLRQLNGPKGTLQLDYTAAIEPLNQYAILPYLNTGDGCNVLPIDIDGDGTTDLLLLAKAGPKLLQIILLKGNGDLTYTPVINQAVPFTDEIQNVLPLDVDGDGVIELVVGEATASDVASGYLGSATLYKPTCDHGTWSLTATRLAMSGKAMLIGVSLNGVTGSVVGIDATGDAADVRVFDATYDHHAETSAGVLGQVTQGLGYGQYFAIDVHGDGVTNLVRVQPGDLTNPPRLWMARQADFAHFTAVPNVDPFASLPSGVLVDSQGKAYTGDINGDGLTDLLWIESWPAKLKVWTVYNTGNGGFVLKSPVPQVFTYNGDGKTDQTSIHLADVDGDGVDELVIFARGVVQPPPGTVAAGQLDSFTGCTVIRVEAGVVGTTKPITTMLPGPMLNGSVSYVPADLFGTGKVGFLYTKPSGAIGYFYTSGSAPDLPAKITNELGGAITIEYSRLTDPLHYSRETCARWLPDEAELGRSVLEKAADGTAKAKGNLPHAFHAPSTGGDTVSGSIGSLRTVRYPRSIVARYRKFGAGGEEENRFEYFYSGARVDLGGRGWLGFDALRVADGPTVRETLLSQVFPFVGTILCTSVQKGGVALPFGGPALQLCTATLTTYDATGLTGGLPPCLPGAEVFFVRQRTNEEWVFDDQGVCEKQSVVMSYNDWGLCTQTTESNQQRAADGTLATVTGLTKKIEYCFYQRDIADDTVAVLQTATPAMPTDERWFTNHIGKVSAVVIDDAGKETTLRSREQTVDARGLLSTSKDHVAANLPIASKTYDYDFAGNCKTVVDHGATPSADDPCTSYEFDDRFHTFVVAVTLPKNADGRALTTSYTYDPRFGLMLSRTDPNGTTLLQELDDLGRRVLDVRGPQRAGESGNFVYSSRRFEAGKCTSQVFENWQGAGALVTSESVDAWGRVCQRVDPDCTGTPKQTTVRFDSLDNVIEQRVLLPDGGCLLRRRRFDEWNRLCREDLSRFAAPSAGGAETMLSTRRFEWFTNFECAISEADGSESMRLSYATFNGRRLLVRRVSGSPGETETTTFAYDPLGRLRAVRDSAGVETRTSYDGLDRLTSRLVVDTTASPENTVSGETIFYDDTARTITRTDRLGNVRTASIDPLGRVLSTVATAGAHPHETGTHEIKTTYQWDRSGTDRTFGLGRLGRVECSSGINYDYDYDANGNVTRQQVEIDQKAHVFTQAFTPTGRVEQIVFPNGARTFNTYRQGAMIASEFQGPADGSMPSRLLTSFAWRSVGDEKCLATTLPNGLREERGYDLQTRLTRQKLGPVNTPITRNAAGDPTREGDIAYAYDDQQRLTQWTRGGVTERFAYLDGDLMQAGNAHFVHDAHRVTGMSINHLPAGDFSYDANGSLTSAAWSPAAGGQSSQSMAYDGAGQMTFCDTHRGPGAPEDLTTIADTVSAETVRFQARYDADGRRFKKSITFPFASQPSYTLKTIAPNYEVMEFDDQTKQTVIYLEGPYGVFAQIADRGAPGSFRGRAAAAGATFLHQDQRGSTVQTSDVHGVLTPVCLYTPYGQFAGNKGELPTRRLFTGAEYDEETGLYYFQSRYYHPVLGRFVQADDRQGGLTEQNDAFHCYAYALNRPLTFVDPSGHAWWDVFADIGYFTMDVGLIIGGAIATPFCPMAGGALIGAGVGGLVYNITALAKGEDQDPRMWAMSLAIGALTGALTGGAAAGAGSVASTVGSSLARVALQVAVGAVVGTGTGVLGQGLQNLANDHYFWEGLDRAAWMGAAVGGGTGLVSGAFSEAVETPLGQQLNTSVTNKLESAWADVKAFVGWTSKAEGTGNWGAIAKEAGKAAAKTGARVGGALHDRSTALPSPQHYRTIEISPGLPRRYA